VNYSEAAFRRAEAAEKTVFKAWLLAVGMIGRQAV
jgi:hypothetical protein